MLIRKFYNIGLFSQLRPSQIIAQRTNAELAAKREAQKPKILITGTVFLIHFSHYLFALISLFAN